MAAMSRLPLISVTVEHTTLAFAIFARTGANASPEAGRSRNSPPITCRLSLKAARSDAGGSSSKSGTAGSGRSTRGRFVRMDARMASRLLIISSAVCLMPGVEGLLRRMRILAVLTPRVETVVEDDARQMGQRGIGRRHRGTIRGGMREHLAGHFHRGFLNERDFVLFHELTPPGVDLLVDVDLDRADVRAAAVQRRGEG